MSALFTIVYAAHANGTHHKLALDALTHLERPDAEAWRRLFLKNVELYLQGSKAPDTEFKDFKNHVLHVRDSYWGGAPEKAANWYAYFVDAMKEGDWARAVYSAGVLSHYYTDPIHPFHTAQSPAENNIHRAAEWSINRSYNELRKDAEAKYADLPPPVADGEHWLKGLVCAGADFSNPHYESLIAHYDIHKGVVDPPAGLDVLARDTVARLIMYASKGFAVILDRAFTEAAVSPPDVSLSVETVLATLKVPAKWLAKRISDGETRKLVEAMYDELKATGKVEANLPEDDRQVRDLYAKEVVAPRAASEAAARQARLASAPKAAAKPATRALAPPASAAGGAAPVARPEAAAPSSRVSASQEPVTVAALRPSVTSVPLTIARPADTAREPRTYLTLTDPLEAAPSIGPKTVEIFIRYGIIKVADFLENTPEDLAELLDDPRFDVATLTDWQDQARLVIDIPGLRGGGAQLLVGAGYRTRQSLAEAEPDQLSAGVLKFAASVEGRRILRDGNPPDVEKIKGWLDAARLQRAA